MTNNHLGWLIVGLGLLALTGICWSGRWRGWVRTAPGFSRATLITIVPGLGLLAAAYGISPLLGPGLGGAVFGIGMFACLAGLVVGLWEPGWYGPRWFREVNRAFASGARADVAWMEADKRIYGETSVDATVRHVHSDRPVPPSQQVCLIAEPLAKLSHLVGTSGAFIFFPHAPVFAVGGKKVQGPVNEVIPAESLEGVSVVPSGTGLDGSVDRSSRRPRVRIDTGEGAWLFEARKAERVAREVEARYLNPETMPYGLPPARGGRRSGGSAGAPDGAEGKA